MIQYPLEFKSSCTSSAGMNSQWTSTSSEQNTLCAIPPEFQGPGGGLSPEDLFNQALMNCFVATFKVYAENSKLTFEKLEVQGRLIVDTNEQKKPVMKSFFLEANITNPSNADKALMLARKASQSGFVLNSVKTECHFDIQIKT